MSKKRLILVSSGVLRLGFTFTAARFNGREKVGKKVIKISFL